MNDLFIENSPTTPLIEFNYNEGEIKIEGRSIPEDPGEFYEKLINWLKKYFENPRKITRIELKLEYVNSGSSKFILGFLKIVKQKYLDGHECIINWYYEEDDEAVMELGEHYKAILKIPFNLIEIY